MCLSDKSGFLGALSVGLLLLISHLFIYIFWEVGGAADTTQVKNKDYWK